MRSRKTVHICIFLLSNFSPFFRFQKAFLNCSIKKNFVDNMAQKSLFFSPRITCEEAVYGPKKTKENNREGGHNDAIES